MEKEPSKNCRKFKKPSVAITLFNQDYTNYISELFISEFGGSYQTAKDLKNTWRKTISPTQKTVDFLILHSKVYIRMLNIPCAKNPQFLKSLTVNIADYLSSHFMEFDGYKGKRQNIKNSLEKVLFDDFDYIQNIIKDLEAKKEQKKNSGHNQIQVYVPRERKKTNLELQSIKSRISNFTSQRKFSSR